MDAYTLRKIAPRILVGVIGINLSIYLCIFAIDLTEIVAKGLHQLLISPFDEAALQNELPAGMTTGTVGAGAAAALGLLAGTIYVSLVGASSVFMIIGILMLLGIVIFVVLALRSALLVLLTIISPVALALFILPGTEKYFRQWWDLFLRALMVYPIIAAMFAVSEVLVMINIDGAAAARDSGASEGAGLVRILLTLFLAFAPLFLIPFAFRFAGGALSTIMNSAGSPIKRMSAARQKYTGQKMRENAAALKSGTRFKGSIPGTQRLANRANLISRGAATGLRGRFGVGERGRAAHHHASEEAALGLMRTSQWQAVKENDNALRAGTYDTADEALNGVRQHLLATNPRMSHEDAERGAQKAVHDWKSSGHDFGIRAQQIAAARGMSETGTAHANMQDMTRTFARVAHQNVGIGESLAGHGNAVAKQIGRGGDLAPGFGTLNNLVQAHGRTGAADREFLERSTDADGNLTQVAFDRATLNAAATAGDPYTFARSSKPQVFDNLRDIQERVDRGVETATTDEEFAVLDDMQDDLGARAMELMTNQSAITAGESASRLIDGAGATRSGAGISAEARRRARVGGRSTTEEERRRAEEEGRREPEHEEPPPP